MLATTHGTKIPEMTITQGMRMAAARKMAGLTQMELANMLGASSRTIIRWEQDEVKVPYIAIVALSVATDVNLGWLQTGEKDIPSTEHLEFLTMEAENNHSAGFVRPEGFEPPTFCFVVKSDFDLAA